MMTKQNTVLLLLTNMFTDCEQTTFEKNVLKKTKQVEGEIDDEPDDSVVSSGSFTKITKAMEHLEARSGG